MPISIWSSEWLNLNSQRRYPLADDANGVDLSGSFTLPTDFLLELDLPVHAGMDVDPARFFVRFIGAYSTGYSIIVGYQPFSGEPVNVATALVPRQAHTANISYALGGIGDFDDTLGKLVIGRLANIDAQPPGLWELSLESGRLDVDAVRPMIRGVTSIVCVNGGQRSSPLQGRIELVAGANMQIVPILAAGQDPVVRFNAINGEGTVEECVCEGDAAPPPPIKRINGVAPTPEGDLTLIGSDCVAVEVITNGLRVRDTCSQPCCGPTELEVITRDLQRLGSQATSVRDFVDRLQQSVLTMDSVVLGSRLGDRTCTVCDE